MRTILLLLIAALMLSGCATIMSGSQQTVTFNSDPPDATVYLGYYKKKHDVIKLNKDNAIALGKTPMTAQIKKNTSLIFYSKDGYKDTIVYFVQRKIRAKYADPQTGYIEVRKIYPAKYYAHTNGWYWADLIFCPTLLGLVAMDIDLLSGSAYRLDKFMSITLEKKK